MKRQAVENLSSVIRANTKQRTLEELAAGGKKSFRVISGSRVMELIHAVVDDAIKARAVQCVELDRVFRDPAKPVVLEPAVDVPQADRFAVDSSDDRADGCSFFQSSGVSSDDFCNVFGVVFCAVQRGSVARKV